MINTMTHLIRHVFWENWAYKFIALLVALVLWVSILSRKDFVVALELQPKLIAPVGHKALLLDPGQKIQIRLAGPRQAIKVYQQIHQELRINLVGAAQGEIRYHIIEENLSLPSGVKVLSIVPDNIIIHIVPKDG